MPSAPTASDTEQSPLLLADGSFVHLLLPFSFSTPELAGPRDSNTFEEVVRSVEGTTVGDTRLKQDVKEENHDQACWEPYEGKNPEYLLSHVEDFLFYQGHAPGSPSEDASSPTNFTAAFSLENQVQQSLLPTRMGKTRFHTTYDGIHYDFPLRIENLRLFLFRSQVGLLMVTLELGSTVSVSEESPLEEAPTDERILWKPEEVFTDHDESDREETETRRLRLSDLIVLNYDISRPTGGEGGPTLYCEERKPKEHLFPDPSETPGNLEDYPDFYRPLSLGRMTRDLLDGAFASTATPPAAEPQGRRWHPFHEDRLLTYVFGLIDEEASESRCSYDRIQRPLYHLRRSFNEKYHPTPQQLQPEDNPEVLRTFENIAFGFSTEGGAALAWYKNGNRDFIANQLPIRIKRNYFFLYLLALHQHYACIYLARRIGNLDYQGIRISSRSTIEAARRLREQIFAFLVRSWFHDVSDRRTYTQVYHKWQQVLDTRRHFDEVKSQVGELDDYLQRIQNDRESRFADLISWVIVPLVLFISAMSMNFAELQNISITNLRVWGGMGIATALYFLIAWGFRRYIR